MKKIRTNCKAVKEAIRAHILEYYSPEELKNQVNALSYIRGCNYHKVFHMVESGCFLIYSYQISEFLNSLGINPDNKEYDPADSFKLYCHLIARDSELIIKHA